MFQFKQFTVRQERAAMKVGTDGVLVGAWTHIPDGCRRILDIGTGTGLIALMAAQRCADALVTGVEADAASAGQARENVAASPWSDRIEIVDGRIQEYESAEPFDLIISNPPYYDGTLVCPDAERTAARHTVALSFSELMASARRLIAADGRFSVIVPTDCVASLVAAGDMHLVRRCDVRTKSTKKPKRTLLEFSPVFLSAPRFGELIMCDDAGVPTADYKSLTGDFYLNL